MENVDEVNKIRAEILGFIKEYKVNPVILEEASKPVKAVITYKEKYSPAMEIKTQAEADEYFEKLVSHSIENFGKTRIEAEECERKSLGYYAGYYDAETRARVEKLFKCQHPVFGSIAENGQPKPEDAFAAGFNIARRQK